MPCEQGIEKGLVLVRAYRGAVTRNVRIGKRRTSLRLERPLWEALAEVAAREALSVDVLVTQIDCHRSAARSLAGAVRVFLLGYFLDRPPRAIS